MAGGYRPASGRSNTNPAVYIGIAYAYLPFMVLPIYTALTRIDYSLVEASLISSAAEDLLPVIVPLTKGGLLLGRCWCLFRR